MPILLFVAQPSTARKLTGGASGVKLVYTPFAREAFVLYRQPKTTRVIALSDVQIRGILAEESNLTE